MKYVYGLILILSLVGLAQVGLLAIGYFSESENFHGLHPALATMLSGVLIFVGAFAATELDQMGA